jgi:hypothetical protein
MAMAPRAVRLLRKSAQKAKISTAAPRIAQISRKKEKHFFLEI